MRLQLTEIVDGIAESRRRHAAIHPEDLDGVEAALLLQHLGDELGALEGSDLHAYIADLYALSNDVGRFAEIVADEIEGVGVRSRPATGRDLLLQIAGRVEGELVRRRAA
jgi:hypothetical protein